VVVSSDGTNEAAYITQARKEAQRMNAVENFCRSFDFEDPDKEYTGIAFLIVCDMLLTGFDAPIEQVMYIDKKLREHTLLQAIARTNRVKKGKQRGYIVDYIGLANHLTDALTLYAASDELQELHDGMKNIASELPVLEERYQRLLQHFAALGIKQIKAFVNRRVAESGCRGCGGARSGEGAQGRQEARGLRGLLKKFLMSLDIILPNASAQPLPRARAALRLHPAGDQGALQGQSLDLGSAGEKVKALINEHLISLGINPKVPPVELLAEDFLDKLAACTRVRTTRPRPARWSTPSASTARFTTMKTRRSTRACRKRSMR
jgi:type I restriction enzyme R subunit